MARLLDRYRAEITPKMMERFGFKNRLRVPRLIKIVVNMGIGEGTADGKAVSAAADEMALITGQRPLINRSRKAVANFKLRQGIPIGCKVTLRGKMMYEFFDRLISVVLPRIRDFRGMSPDSFDGRGNYTLGLEEQIVFPEVDMDHVTRVQGMDITVVTSAKNNEEARELLTLMGMPFRKQTG
ncbi:MAG: 50S ribosomal protein L5 [Candidatus Aureabacteria bacterium]|nr:50S ribosomal protein L5 [Candidatus Auribacterota bacterium]